MQSCGRSLTSPRMSPWRGRASAPGSALPTEAMFRLAELESGWSAVRDASV